MGWLRDWLTRDTNRKLDALRKGLLVEADRILAAIEMMKGDLMAGVAELQQAIADEGVEIQHVADAVTAETSRVEAVIAALRNAPPDPAVTQAIADLQAHTESLKTIAQGLDAVEA